MGKTADLSPRKVALTKVLLEENHYSQREIANKLNISQKSVSRIKLATSNNEVYESNRIGKCGRKRKMNERLKRKLKNLVIKNRRSTKKQLAEDMKAYGVNVSSRTVLRTLKDEGLNARRPRKKQKITPAMAKKRLQWAKGLKHWTQDDWKKVIFSDESIFQVSDITSQFVRRRSGEEFHEDCVMQTVKHPTSVMVWSSMSVHGPGRLYVVEKTMRQDQYLNVLQRRMVPQAKDWFPDDEYVFMHDGAPCHKAKTVTTFLTANEISVLPWPGNSPDMNPIENLWAIVKKRIKKQKITTKTGLIEMLIKVWHHDQEIKDSCQKLVESMPNRLALLIKNKGLHTKY